MMLFEAASIPVLPLIQDAPPPVAPWLLVIIAILLIILFIWLLLRERRARGESAPAQSAKTTPAAPAAMPVNVQPVEIPNPAYRSGGIAAEPVETPVAPVVDDLEIIEGIGPKIASVLKQAGITSFAQLAATEPARITEILLAANLRLADPTSWPEQARLAANGDMTALQSLQDRLKGGR